MITTENKSMLAGSILALTATMVWSGNFIAAKALTPDLSAVAMNFWRWSVAVIFMLPFGLKAFIAHRHLLFAEWKLLNMYAFVGICLANVFYYKAPETASAVNMVILAATAPLFMMVYARVFFGEPITMRRLSGAVIALGGVATLVTRGQPALLLHMSLTPGDFWTLSGAACFSFYSVSLRWFKGKEQVPISAFLLAIFALGWLWSIPFYLTDTRFVLPLSGKMLPGVLYIGCMAAGVAFMCWNAAIARIGAVRAGIIYYLLPVFGCMAAVIVLGEQLSLPQIFGGLLVLGGVVLSSLPRFSLPWKH